MMKRTPKTPALAKLAMLLLFAIAAVAILDTTSISAQEPGRTITSPFGVANPYMNASDASESGSDGDTFVDPETGEVGHIIRNPFGVANPEGVDTGIDIPDDAGEEVGGIITSPFGVPASDDIDTGVDVFDEDEEYLISLPDDEESEVEESENVDEVDDETSDDEKEIEEESAGTTTEKYVPVIDNPIRGVEFESFSFTLTGASGNISIDSEVDNISDAPMLYVATGSNLDLVLTGTTTMQSDRATISIVNATNNFPSNEFALQEISFDNNDHTIVFKHNVSSSLYNGSYNVTVSYRHSDVTVTRCLKVEIVGFRLQMPRKIIGVNNLDRDRDGVPDFADGFDCVNGGVSAAGKSAPFAELKLAVLSDIVNSDYAVEFCFDESPYTVIRNGDNTEANPYCYKPEEFGQLRIWTKDGGEARLKAPITATSPGDCVPRNTTIPLNKLFSGTAQANTPLETTLYVEAINPSTTFGGSPITVKLYKNGMERINNSIPTTAVKVDYVTPNETSDGSKAIKIMIETNEEAEAFAGGDRYYTSAQTEDHKVNITATITPTIRGVTVYFEVIDPDDLSPYEGKDYDTHGFTNDEEDLFANDNLDPLKSMLDEPEQEEPLEQEDPRGQGESQQEEEQPQPKNYTAFQACLSTRSATTDEHGKATVVLDITNQYSGDNYIVRASCIDPGRIDQVKLRPFDKYSIAPPPVSGVTNNEKLGSLQYESKTTIAQTVLLVAWKRTYIVDIRMAVESTKFNYNNRMAIKSDALTENVPLEQSQINPTKDTGILFYSLDHSMLVNSFGYAPHGIDGGVFIEFKILSPSIYIPYHIKFGDCSKAYEFVNCYIMSSGYSQFTNKKNIAFVASISDAYDETGIGTRGFTIGETVIILMDAHIGNFANTQNFTLTHEMGHVWKTHQYEPFRLHVDNDCDSSCSHLRLNHESIDQCCTMVYCDSRLFSTSEFCFACIRKCLRARKNPFDPNIIPSGGMIQEE